VKKLEDDTRYRAFCYTCRRPLLTCYCQHVKPFESSPRFVILMHPHEVKKPIGTGRMAHQCLKNSTLWIGQDFANSEKLNQLISDPDIFPMLLFPGSNSHNLTTLDSHQRKALCPGDKELVIILLDATWIYAKKMLYRSPNLQKLPRICFNPPHLSKFIVRKQPNDECFSTIEAIDEILNLLGSKNHGHLMEVFLGMVDRQLSFRKRGNSRHRINYYKRKGFLVEEIPSYE
jgi:DTW domain-containing protein